MADIRWFIDKMRDPRWVDRVEEPQEEEEVDSVIPPGGVAGAPAPTPPSPQEVPLNPNAVTAMASQMWNEGGEQMPPLENPAAAENPLSQNKFPMGKKLQMGVNMRNRSKKDFGLEPTPSFLGGGKQYGG